MFFIRHASVAVFPKGVSPLKVLVMLLDGLLKFIFENLKPELSQLSYFASSSTLVQLVVRCSTVSRDNLLLLLPTITAILMIFENSYLFW